MQMKVLSTRIMAEDGDKHKNNANEVAKNKNDAKIRLLSTKTIQISTLSKRTMSNEVVKHMLNDK